MGCDKRARFLSCAMSGYLFILLGNLLLIAIVVYAASRTPRSPQSSRSTQAPSPPTAPGGDAGTLIAQIDALLPQTQCGKCGYPGCKPYAEAIAKGEADINQCPPGGDAGIHRLAELLGRDYKPLSPAHGMEKPPEVAVIDEARCIGCTLCIQACPVDAIVGAPKQMHTVIAAQCTGCDLCLPPCPVDCIAMVPVAAAEEEASAPWPWSPAELARRQVAADAARARYEFRQFRLAREAEEKAARLQAKFAVKLAEKQAENQAADQTGNHASMADAAAPTAAPTVMPAAAGKIDKAALIAAALARARAQQAQAQPKNTTDLTAEQQAEIAAIDARRAQGAARSTEPTAVPTELRQK